MAKAKHPARAILTEAEMAMLARLIDSYRLYVVPHTKAMKPRKVASASLTDNGRGVLFYLSQMPTELP